MFSLLWLIALNMLVSASFPSIFFSTSSLTLLIIFYKAIIESACGFGAAICVAAIIWSPTLTSCAPRIVFSFLKLFPLLSVEIALLMILRNLSKLPTRWIISLTCFTMYSSVTSYSISSFDFCLAAPSRFNNCFFTFLV